MVMAEWGPYGIHYVAQRYIYWARERERGWRRHISRALSAQTPAGRVDPNKLFESL
jgi:hypothetical protein